MSISTKLLATTAAILLAAVAVCGCDQMDPYIEDTGSLKNDTTDAITEEFTSVQETETTLEEGTDPFTNIPYPTPSDFTVRSAHFTLDTIQLNVYRNMVVEDNLRYYYRYLLYGLKPDSDGILNTYSTEDEYVNATLPYKLNDPELDEDVSAQAQKVLDSCEAALADGTYDTLKGEVAPKISDHMANLRATAQKLNMSYDVYLAAYFNKNTSENDIITALEYYYVHLAKNPQNE